PMDRAEMRGHDTKPDAVRTDQGRRDDRAVSRALGYGSELSVSPVELDVLDDDALALAQRPAAGGAVVGRNITKHVQKRKPKALVGGDPERLAGVVQQLNVAPLGGQQLDHRDENLVQSLIESARTPQTRAQVAESRECRNLSRRQPFRQTARGNVACDLG